MSPEERHDQAASVEAAPRDGGPSAAAEKPETGRKARPRGSQPHGPGFGPPGLIGSGEKAKDFKGSFKRLVGRLRPERSKIVLIILLAVISVTCTVAAPKILAQATNLIFSGVVSKQLPAGRHPGAGGRGLAGARSG